MTSLPSTFPSTATEDDDLDARCRDLGGRILDGVAAALDRLALEDELSAIRRAAVTRAVWAQCAPAACPNATCRRARRCRHDRCAVAPAGLLAPARMQGVMPKRRGDFPKKLDYAAPMEPFWKKA